MLNVRVAGQHSVVTRGRSLEGLLPGGDAKALPLIHWDGRAPTALIARVEARLASGEMFVVLAAAPPLGQGSDGALLERWWREAGGRTEGKCVAWAVVVQGADVNPALLQTYAGLADIIGFPIRSCADQPEALRWLRARLAEEQTGPCHH